MRDGLRRGVIFLPLLACDGRPVAPEPAFAPTKIVVPVPGAGAIATPTTRITTPALAASEGRLEARATKATVGVGATAWVRIFPAAGYHINTEYPFSLTLADPPAGMTFPQAVIEAGDTVSEGQLAVPIALTATQAGTFRVTGSIQFGICESDRCLSRAMPVVVEVTSCDSGSAC